MIKTIAYIELLIALVFCGVAIWSITGLYTCPPEYPVCKGWSWLGFYIAAPAGILAAIAAVWFLKTRKWLSQSLMIVALAWVIWNVYFS